MAWRGVHISEAARLKIDHRQFVVARSDGEVAIAVEDLAFLVLDTPQATITSAALAALLEEGAVIIQCDAKHLPTGLALPFHAHFRQGEIARRQIAVTTPFKKRCWQAIVRAKILNQALALDGLEREGETRLRALAARVGSGDPENIEAQAARWYWSKLFDGFRRDDAEDRRNAMLNYGYAVLRACVARSLVASGLLPAFGLHHHSAANAFNLADDLLEPFRPVVDICVVRRLRDAPIDAALTLDDRRAMAATPSCPVKLGRETLTVLAACDRVTHSLCRAINSGDWRLLKLPSAVVEPAA